MKTIIISALLLTCINIGDTKANATLLNVSNSSGNVIYDNIANKYWIHDLSLFFEQSYLTQLNTIASLDNSSYFGINTWHMASLPEINTLWTYTAANFSLFQDTYVEGGASHYFGRYNSSPGAGDHYTADVSILGTPPNAVFTQSTLQTISWPDSSPTVADIIAGEGPRFPSAWVVADGPATVPESGTMVLVSLGLIICAVYSKRHKVFPVQ